MFSEQVLEFAALRSLLGRSIRSPLGRAELESLTPLEDRAAIEVGLAEASEAIAYLRASAVANQGKQKSGQPPSGGTIRLRFNIPTDPREMVALLRIEGTSLDATQLHQLAKLLDVAAEIRSNVLAVADRFPLLAGIAEQVADLSDLARDLTDKILPDGSLADHASVALNRIRRDAERQYKAIEDSLQRFLRAHSQDGTLQEEFITIRNDRWVVPVVSGRQRQVNGVIHGSSGSGQSVFVEPLETIALNNELVRLREEEQREIQRLLKEFTSRLRKHAGEIRESVAALGRLELLFAKADFAVEFNCCVPRLSDPDQDSIILKEARHPLLADILRKQKRTVEAMSVTLQPEQRTLLISGPNTGGKTVTLKTIGLLALMTHAAVPVPAIEAEFPLFDQVLADIGDHQSLEESLSSFSSHIVSVSRMLDAATGDSLILMDELGRATDPEEGGALGVTILEAFRRRGAFTVASTHLTAMKIYGASTPGVLNGSMGFDDETLEPTYVLRLGAPGKSAGLDIASRLGLDAGLIAEARSRMGEADRDIARFLAKLNQQLEEVQAERARLEERTRELEVREHSYEKTLESKYAVKLHELEQKAGQLSSDFQTRADELLADLSQKQRARVSKARREFQESVEALAPQRAAAPASTTGSEKSAAPAPKPKLEVGARVRLKGVRTVATVKRLRDNGAIEVEAGFLRMQVGFDDIEAVLAPVGDQPKRPSGVRLKQGPSQTGSYHEINLIGQRAEQACENVDKFLDNAALAEVDRVRIVHGHGMGILKRAIADLLAANPHVEKFYPAEAYEGGAGATIVELK